jgi:hypothetical protein
LKLDVPLMVLAVCSLASARALPLSAVAPELLDSVNVSPAFGVPSK